MYQQIFLLFAVFQLTISTFVSGKVEFARGSKDDVIIRQVIGGKDELERHRNHFEAFKRKFSKFYVSQEEHDYRFSVFRTNMRRAKRHQKLDPLAVHGVTRFFDMTSSEFQKHLGLRSRLRIPADASKAPILPTSDLPGEFDWRQHGAVTEVKDQVFLLYYF